MAELKKSDRSAWWLAVAGIIGVVAGALVTGAFNYLDHQRDLDAKMIELGVGILRTDPSPETAPLREWAIDVIQNRAGFSFNDAQRAALLHRELPFKTDQPAWLRDFNCKRDSQDLLYAKLSPDTKSVCGVWAIIPISSTLPASGCAA